MGEGTSGALLEALGQAEALLLLSSPELHQQQQAAAETAASLAAAQKRCVAAIAAASADTRQALERALKVLGEFDRAAAAGVAVPDIVAYAQRISGTTSAPAYWKPGMPMVGFLPPAPLPEMMRMGALTRFNASRAATTAKPGSGAVSTIADYFTPGTPAAVKVAPTSPAKAKAAAPAVKAEAKEGELKPPAPLHRAPSMAEKPEAKRPKFIVDLDDMESSSEESGSGEEDGDSDSDL